MIEDYGVLHFGSAVFKIVRLILVGVMCVCARARALPRAQRRKGERRMRGRRGGEGLRIAPIRTTRAASCLRLFCGSNAVEEFKPSPSKGLKRTDSRPNAPTRAGVPQIYWYTCKQGQTRARIYVYV